MDAVEAWFLAGGAGVVALVGVVVFSLGKGPIRRGDGAGPVSGLLGGWLGGGGADHCSPGDSGGGCDGGH